MIRKKAVLITSLLFVSFSFGYVHSQFVAQSLSDCSILSSLKSEFQRRNSRISSVKIVDVRPTLYGPSKYLVVGWGVRADFTFKGSFEDELFGLFIVDGSLTHVEKILDFIPTPRWLDTPSLPQPS